MFIFLRLMLRRFIFISQSTSDAIAHTFNSTFGYEGNLSKDKIWQQTRQIQRGRAYSFNGANQYVQLPNNPIFNLVDLTISVKFIAWSINNTRLVSKDNNWDPWTRKLISMKWNSLWTWRPWCWVLVWWNFIFLDAPTALIPWQHYTMTMVRKDWQYLRLYINKILVAQINSWLVLWPIDSNVWPTLWAYKSVTNGWEYFDWSLYDLRIYNTTKTLQEIENIENGLRDIIWLVAHYKTDESTGTTAYDSSWNWLHWSLINGVTHTTRTDGFGSDFQNQVGYTEYQWFVFTAWRYLRNTTNAINFAWDFSFHTVYSWNNPATFSHYIFSVWPTVQRIQIDKWWVNFRILFTNPANISFDIWIPIKTERTKITIIKTGNTWTCYENGILRNTFVYTFTPNLSWISLGTDSDPWAVTNWRMERAQVWTRTLSAGEIASLQDVNNPTPAWALLDYQLNGNTRNLWSWANATVVGTATYFQEYIPRNEFIPTQDVLWNTLQYSWRVKYDAQLWGRYYVLNWANQYLRTNYTFPFDAWQEFTLFVWSDFLTANTSDWILDCRSDSTVWFFCYLDVSTLYVWRNTTWVSWYIATAEIPIWTNIVQITHPWWLNANDFFIYADWVQLAKNIFRNNAIPSLCTATATIWYKNWTFTSWLWYYHWKIWDISLISRSKNITEIQADYKKWYQTWTPSDFLFNFSCDEWIGTVAYSRHEQWRTANLVNWVSHATAQWQGSIARQVLGYTDNAWVAIPRNEAIPSQDVLWNPLQYVWDDQSLLPWWRVNFDTAPAPELIRAWADKDYTHWDTLPVNMRKTVDWYKENNFLVLNP